MTDPHVLIRQRRDRKAYRLKCRFAIEAYPKADWLDKAKFAAAQKFVEDMAKQGWENVQKFGFGLSGPYPPTETVILPKRSTQVPWHIPSADLLPAIAAGYRPGRDAARAGAYTREVPALTASVKWEYELTGVFFREELLVEYPDAHEERMT